MFKIILSIVVLVAVIGISSSAPLLGPQGTDIIADVYDLVFVPFGNILGGGSGLLVEGSDGAQRGIVGGGAVARKLGQSIRNTGNAGTNDQLGAILGAVTGIVDSGLVGTLSTLLNGSINQGVKDANAAANRNINLGTGVSALLG